MHLVVLNQTNWLEGIRELFFNDSDWNGSNGVDYTSDAAKEEGFTSDLDYSIHRALLKHGLKWDLVVETILLIYVHNDINMSYYGILEYQSVKLEDNLVVALIAKRV